MLALELALELPGLDTAVTGTGSLAAWTAASGEDPPEEWVDDIRGGRVCLDGPVSDTERTCVMGTTGRRFGSMLLSDWMVRWDMSGVECSKVSLSSKMASSSIPSWLTEDG